MSELRIRRRDPLTSRVRIGEWYIHKSDGSYVSNNGYAEADCEISPYQITMDENHGDPPYNEGGPFWSYRFSTPLSVVCSGSYPKTRAVGVGNDIRYVGYNGGFVLANIPSLSLGNGPHLTGPDDYRATWNENNLQDLGNRAYSKLRPKVNRAGVFQAVVEGRDLPRMLKTSAKGFYETWKSVAAPSVRHLPQMPKKAAEQFINVQFGWKPFLKDLNDVIDTTQNFQVYVERQAKRNNRWIRRVFAEDEVQTSTLVSAIRSKPYTSPSWVSFFSPFVGSGGTNHGVFSTQIINREVCTRVWYAGRCRMWYPEFDKGVDGGYTQAQLFQQSLTLYGANISPTNVWKVCPWSWLIDWFTNVGDNIQVFSDMVGGQVVFKYLYLMREVFDRFAITCTQTSPFGPMHAGTAYREVRTKRRVSSESPFGFTLLPQDLSGMQYTILGALGLSKWG